MLGNILHKAKVCQQAYCLLNIQKLEDGDTFSGKTSATDDFAPIAGMKAEAASDNSLFE